MTSRRRAAVSRIITSSVLFGLTAVSCGTGGEDVQAPPLVTRPVDTGATETTPTATSDDPDRTVEPGTTSSTSSTSTSQPLPPVVIEQIDCPSEIRADGLSCGLATVPLDRRDPGAGTTVISLAALDGRAPDLTPPLAVLQGGPGGSSTELTEFYPRRDYTQIFIDQRGTGFAESDFDCPEVDEALVEILGAASDEAEEIELAAYDRCAARLRDDRVFAETDTENHAGDVADVMTALGYDAWLVYGVSYGTTIALELMREAPAGLKGAVLDGAYPPDLDIDAALGESATTALAELDRACAEDEACDAILDDVTGTLESLMDRFEAEPITVGVDERETVLGEDLEVVIDDEVLAGMVFRFLYDEASLRFVPGMLDGLDRGDPGTIRWLARAVVNRSVSALRSNDDGTWFAVQCADRLPFTNGPAATLSDFAAAIAVPGLDELCEPWQRPPSAAVVAEPVHSDIPTLVLGGQFDPITPPYFATRAASTLSSATVIIRPGRGHGVWYGDECVGSLVDAFVSDPGSELDTTCADAGHAVAWARPAG